uniref:Uncharacterized protein n=1 Tax=Ralstonia solanacearum TaxID=305 RepID=A0A0S4WYP0_RALSL|nr:protein of unknown function [Ralstonia solanacearum]
MRDVGDDEGAQVAPAARADRARGAGRQRRQQRQHALALLHDDLARAHGLGRKQIHLLQLAVPVRDQVDGRRHRGHLEGRIGEWILHGRSGSDAHQDAQCLELRDRGVLLDGGDAGGPLQRVAGDDGVARDQEAVVTVGQVSVARLHQHTGGVLAAIGGGRVKLLDLARGGHHADHGAQGQGLAGGHGDALARVQVGRLVFEEVAQVQWFLKDRHGS